MSHPQLQMEDYGGNRGANVMIRCPSCRAKRNISRAMGRRGAENLPACRGRHPHLSIVQRALRDARRCSSDPLCAERLPKAPADFLHGAACHACLFVSETTCERGNRFLDRRFIVPIDDQFPTLIPS